MAGATQNQLSNIIKNKRTSGDFVFSILIPTWNNLNYLKLCIDSIRKNSSANHQIIVHVNEGKDGTLEWMQQQKDLDFTYSETNIGICYALNICRGLAVTDYIVYMNDDMYVCPGWDTALIHEIKGIDHSFFFLSSTAIEPVASSDCVIEKDYGTSVETFNEDKLLKEYKSFFHNDWTGATWPPNVVHKDVWDAVGGYSVEFSPGMYSDPDFSMKLWRAGIRLFKGISESRVYHFGSKSTTRMVKNSGYYTFIAKWGMTSRTFTHNFLKRGKEFSGNCPEYKMNGILKVKSLFKRIITSVTHFGHG